MPLARRRVLLKRSGNSYSCSGNCSSNYCASYNGSLDGCYNCSNSCTSNCTGDCTDVCSSDCRPVICHNCALADTCTTDHPICKDLCGCDCVTDCPSKHLSDTIDPCAYVES